ncbi:YqkE family protein [Kurthia zopfii]|uniref:YqkE family protein n=1 Tax=Kurthia zopfii TaxID=1650 RepID=UPI003519F86B
MSNLAKKKQHTQQRQQQQQKSVSADDQLTLKDQLNDDVLSKLKMAKQSLVTEAKEKEEERQAKAAFDKKQKEKNMSFEELLNQYGNQGSKF